MTEGRRLLGQILKDHGVVREGHVQEALAKQRAEGGLLGQCLVELGHATQADVVMALAEQAGMESIDLDAAAPTEEALAMVDSTTARAYGVLPLRLEDGVLVVAIGDPLNTALLDDLEFTTGTEVRGAVADAQRLRALVVELYGEEEDLSDAISDAANAVRGADLEAAASSQPVARLLNSILYRAVRDRASDVHFEVFGGEFRIRYRVDGSLYEIEAPPEHLSVPLVSRIKVMADLDITETRMPQDGRIELAIDGRAVDLRVATLPGIAGEGCVMRVLDRSSVSLELAALGLGKEEEDALRALTELPNGIVLVTGPTGSGKTTTLYAMLQETRDEAIKVITVEDPVEYDIEGIVQIPINDDIGVTYARVLRTVLRQDPDKILVGEIRDRDTATTAVEASLTGHTVFSTIHTNDAPSTVTRLIDMGVQPYLISATLEAIVAQRLVRTICSDCRESFEPDDEMLTELGPDGEALRGRTLHHGRGCDSCHHTGYRGRMGIFEIMRVDEDLRAAILDGAGSADLRIAASQRGMRSLRESGLRAVTEGRTTVEEILRETIL